MPARDRGLHGAARGFAREFHRLQFFLNLGELLLHLLGLGHQTAHSAHATHVAHCVFSRVEILMPGKRESASASVLFRHLLRRERPDGIFINFAVEEPDDFLHDRIALEFFNELAPLGFLFPALGIRHG